MRWFNSAIIIFGCNHPANCGFRLIKLLLQDFFMLYHAYLVLFVNLNAVNPVFSTLFAKEGVYYACRLCFHLHILLQRCKYLSGFTVTCWHFGRELVFEFG